VKLERKEGAGARAASVLFRQADPSEKAFEAAPANLGINATVVRQQGNGLTERDGPLALQFLTVF
jgi:hypothetical protein